MKSKRFIIKFFIDSLQYLILKFFSTTRKASGQSLTKQMDNPIFVNNKNIPLVTHHNEDCDDDNDYDD